MAKEYLIGTRGSALALVQAREAVSRLREAFPGVTFRLRNVKSRGDEPCQDTSPGKGAFVKALQDLLVRGEIDLAVHSLKDLPANLEDTEVAVFLPREDPRDVLVSQSGAPLEGLPPGSVIGTSSPRRLIQLKLYRSDLTVKRVRGNVDTRLSKAASGEVDALILAAAGLIRLGFQDRITQYLPLDHFLPSAGQGVIAIEARKGDRPLGPALAALDHLPTRMEALAERAFVRELHADCDTPVGAYASVEGRILTLRVMYVPNGEDTTVWGEIKGSFMEGEKMASFLASKILENPNTGEGAREAREPFTWRIRKG